jgi:hypothetical protein
LWIFSFLWRAIASALSERHLGMLFRKILTKRSAARFILSLFVLARAS